MIFAVVRKHIMACMHWAGTHGYGGQQKGYICDAHGSFTLIRSILKLVFTAFEGFVVLTRRSDANSGDFCAQKNCNNTERWCNWSLYPLHMHMFHMDDQPLPGCITGWPVVQPAGQHIVTVRTLNSRTQARASSRLKQRCTTGPIDPVRLYSRPH